MTMNKRQIGSCWEQSAASWLQTQGYQILAMNYRCRAGEIDIIGKEQNYLVFIEVKYRRTRQFGAAVEAVTPQKQKTIRRVAESYLLREFHSNAIPCRFDVVGIEGDGSSIHLIRNAF